MALKNGYRSEEERKAQRAAAIDAITWQWVPKAFKKGMDAVKRADQRAKRGYALDVGSERLAGEKRLSQEFEEFTGKVSASFALPRTIRIEDFASQSVPAPLGRTFTQTAPVTLEQISSFVYRTPEYAYLLKARNNLVPFGINSLGQATYIRGNVYCPERIKLFTDTVEAAGELVVSKGVKFHLPRVEKQRELLERAYKEGLAILFFDGRDQTFLGSSRETVELTIKGSTHESMRVMEVTFPYPGGEPHMRSAAHNYGNEVMVGYNGEVIFAGTLISPKISMKKGRTISWVAYSHSFVASKTHFNPDEAKVQWADLSPLEVIKQVSDEQSVPIILGEGAEEDLAVPYVDEDKMSQIQADIRSTTPVKLITQMAAGAGYFVYADAKGYLNINRPPMDRDQRKNVRFAFGVDSDAEYEATFNYAELASGYSVASQRREADSIALVKVDVGVLPIFKNLVRENAFGDLGQQAKFEVSKTLGRSYNVKVSVPTIVAPDGKPWKLQDTVTVEHPLLLGLHRPLAFYVAGIEFGVNKDWERAVLTLWLPDPWHSPTGKSFGVVPYLPFLTRGLGGEEHKVEVSEFKGEELE